MTSIFAAVLLAAQSAAPIGTAQAATPAPVPPMIQVAPVELPLDQQTALTCATAIAMVADWQSKDVAGGDAYPPLQERGKEFFVRTMAQLMDDAGLPRKGIEWRLGLEAKELGKPGRLDEVMPACLLLLDASGI